MKRNIISLLMACCTFAAATQRPTPDRSRKVTYGPLNDLVKRYGGAYGLGLLYAHDMLKH